MTLHRTNWHEAAVCAIQIDLTDYAHMLEYHPEYTLSNNKNRIDLLVIRKLLDQPILKSIGRLFKSYNLFEIKGICSCLTTDAYYKTNGHASYLINAAGTLNQYSRQDVTLTFLSFRYPRKLFSHLQRDCKKEIKRPFPGIYYIKGEMYETQVIITRELAPEDALYLRCLTNHLTDSDLLRQLTEDYKAHQHQEFYIKYLNQLTNANGSTKGDHHMVCEGLFRLYGTSSKEIEENAKKESLEQINSLTDQNQRLSIANQELSSQNNYLKELLTQNNIAF